MLRSESVAIKGPFSAIVAILLLLMFSSSALSYPAEEIYTGSFYSWLRMLVAMSGNPNAGRGISEYILTLAPTSMSDTGYSGWYLMQTGDYNEAIPYFDNALLVDPGNPEYFSGRGFCFFSIGRLESAIGDLSTAIELDSLRIRDYEFLGRAHSENGNINDAHYWFTRGIELSYNAEELSNLHYYRARCYRLAGDYDSAHLDLDQAIYYNPGTPYPHSKKGELYYLTLRDEDAIESFSKAIELGLSEGQLADVLFQRALSYIEMNEYDAALSDINEVLRYQPERVNAYFFRGLSYFYKGEDDNCANDLEYFLAVGADPNLIPEARNILGATEIYRQQR